MNFSLDIARRYLLGKKSNNAINIITWISILGITIGTAALILILSVFNGFEALLTSMFDSFNPDMKVMPVTGKTFSIEDEKIKQLEAIPGIALVSKSIEEIALFEYKGSQEVGTIKGVDNHYAEVTSIDTTVKRGNYVLKENDVNYAVVGAGMRTKLSVNYNDAITPITVHMPKREKKGLMGKDFKTMRIYPAGIFSSQSEVDLQYILTNYEFVNKLLDFKNKCSAIELKLDPSHNEKQIRSQLNEIMGDGFIIKNSYEQNESYLKIMNIEKWIAFLIASMTLFMIAFNMVGCLWMIVLDKRKDISILRAMGMTSKDIKRIFLNLGMLIGGLGIIIGLGLALILYFLQKQYGLVGVPDGFMMSAYPIELKWSDFVIVIATVVCISLLASILPAVKASRVMAQLRAT